MSWATLDSLMNRIVDHMGHVEDSDVRDLVTSFGPEAIADGCLISVCQNLPITQRWIACSVCQHSSKRCLARDHFVCLVADVRVMPPKTEA